MRNLFIILLATLVVVGCKKEAKIEKNLYKGGGEWNISEMEGKETYKYGTEPDTSYVLKDIGTIKFNKDGSGVTTFKFGNQVMTDNFTYTNTETTLTMTSSDGEKSVVDMDWKKDEMILTSTETEIYDSFDEETFQPIEEEATYYTKMTCKKK